MLAMQKLKQPICLRAALCCYSIKVQVSGICNFIQCNPLCTVIFLMYGLLGFNDCIMHSVTTFLTIYFADPSICHLYKE